MIIFKFNKDSIHKIHTHLRGTMKKMFLLFSHNLTKLQENDAIETFKIEEFVNLPQNLQNTWSGIPSNLENLNDYLMEIKTFLKENSNFGDIALIQGDFGATYSLVNFSKDLGLVPVYATTNRVIEEFKENGKTIKKSVFEHIKFREYL